MLSTIIGTTLIITGIALMTLSLKFMYIGFKLSSEENYIWGKSFYKKY